MDYTPFPLTMLTYYKDMNMETNTNMGNGTRQILVEFPPVVEKLDVWYLDEVPIEPIDVLLAYPICPN